VEALAGGRPVEQPARRERGLHLVALLGGATRTLLAAAPLPVLLSH
jgi:nucleotide-binding universal stress UspA family protein